MLDKSKSDYDNLKKTVDDLRTSEVFLTMILAVPCLLIFLEEPIPLPLFVYKQRHTFWLVVAQVDADFKLKDMKKLYKELEMKAKGYKKRLGDLQISVMKHIEQYGSAYRLRCEYNVFDT